MSETHKGTVSSNSRFQAVLFQQYSAKLSAEEVRSEEKGEKEDGDDQVQGLDGSLNYHILFVVHFMRTSTYYIACACVHYTLHV